MTAFGMLRSSFSPSQVYLDSATYGLPPTPALEKLTTVTQAWASGSYDPLSCDQAIASAAADHGALTLIDATQASGWLPLDASLCHPRGTAFMAVRPDVRDRLVPAAAGWYAGEQPWQTCYGTPLRLADDARRFDVSPAWLSWHAAAATLELFAAAGIQRIHEHNVALANRLRAGLGLDPGESAIVSFDTDHDAPRRLAHAGVKVSVRDGRVRLSCHLYNKDTDIDRALEALSPPRHRIPMRD